MDEAQALFREGVLAIKEANDFARARQLLSQSLKLNPNNEMAWLWLARTTDDPARQLQCAERALKINPNSQPALALQARLTAASVPPAAPPLPKPVPAFYAEPEPPKAVPAFYAEPEPEPEPPAAPARDLISQEELDAPTAKTLRDRLTADEEQRIARHLAAAESKANADDEEGAVEELLYALQIQIDHPQAMARIVRLLYKMKYTEDAQEVLQRAIDAGTPSTSVYLTAIDVNKALGNYRRTDELRDALVTMAEVAPNIIIKVIDSLLNDIQHARAIELLEKVLETRPEHDLYMKLGNIYEDQGRKALAMSQYEKAARLASGAKRRGVDQSLATFTPVITDAERGSIPLALREAAGVTAAFLFLAWQDGGLNLLRLTPGHWLGIGLSFVGGYLLITATSSPQQVGLAAALGGQVPDAPEGGSFTAQVEIKPWEEHVQLPPGPMQDPTRLPILPSWARALFAIVGLAILAGAFYLVFNRSIALLRNPVTPDLPSISDFIDSEE